MLTLYERPINGRMDNSALTGVNGASRKGKSLTM